MSEEQDKNVELEMRMIIIGDALRDISERYTKIAADLEALAVTVREFVQSVPPE